MKNSFSKPAVMRWMSRIITGLGFAVVGLLVIPAIILIALILAVRTVTDKTSLWIDRKGKEHTEVVDYE